MQKENVHLKKKMEEWLKVVSAGSVFTLAWWSSSWRRWHSLTLLVNTWLQRWDQLILNCIPAVKPMLNTLYNFIVTFTFFSLVPKHCVPSLHWNLNSVTSLLSYWILKYKNPSCWSSQYTMKQLLTSLLDSSSWSSHIHNTSVPLEPDTLSEWNSSGRPVYLSLVFFLFMKVQKISLSICENLYPESSGTYAANQASSTVFLPIKLQMS